MLQFVGKLADYWTGNSVPISHDCPWQFPVRRIVGFRRWAVVFRIHTQALVFALGMAAAVLGQPAIPADRGVIFGQAAAPVIRTGIAIYRGQELRYEIVDGLAIHGGDMVLGTVEEVAAKYRRRRSKELSPSAWIERRDISAVEDRYLWPDGRVPYVIDPGFEEKALHNIREGIDEWNSKTVISLVERTTETDYVRFRPLLDSLVCLADLGKTGGEQFILLSPVHGCGVGGVLHEIGHAVGLHHEHQRKDRDLFVSVSDVSRYGGLGQSYFPNSPVGGPYDYASVMNYIQIETIPPGMPVPGYRLSAGDIDGVARLYGSAPTATTVSTNPEGLEILVDGRRVVTPAQFRWSPGSTHSLQALSPQTIGAQRFVFGRWNDEGDSQRTVTAGPESTWFEANYIVQQRMLACADPSGDGTVRVRPDSRDGYFVAGASIELEADLALGSSREFLHWSPPPVLSRYDRRSIFSRPGLSANPASGSTPVKILGTSHGSPLEEFAAIYRAKPLYLVDSNVDGIDILVDGESKPIPWAFPADAFPNGVAVEAPLTVPDGDADGHDVRYRFSRWSDGGSRARTIAVPATGGSVRLEVTREYRLRTHAILEDAIKISPYSEDGFYADGTLVQVTAIPAPGWHFAGWTGEVSGSDRQQAIVMDAAKSLEAVFTQSMPLEPEESTDLTFPSSSQFRLYAGADGFNVLVPPGAAELTVQFQSSSTDEADLYVQPGYELWWEDGDTGETPRVRADFKSTSRGANKTITITRESTPPLANAVYYIGLAVPPQPRRIRGTLLVQVRASGIARARPRAFTFVSPAGSDPVPQEVRLTHQTTGAVRYRIASNASWLGANPQEWVHPGAGVKQISITANSAGMAVGTHRGSLTILQAGSGGASGSWTPTGLEVLVAFAVIPATGDSAVSRRSNPVTIESLPQNGDTYGAGEEIIVRVDFANPVEVAGSPALTLGVGNRTRQAAWNESGWTSICEGGYKSLHFRYVVDAGDRDPDGISIASDVLALNSGSIRTVDGTAPVLALAWPAIGNAPDHKVDGSRVTPPVVSGVSIAGSPQDGVAYGAGESIFVHVWFSQEIEVTGSPTLALGVGEGTRRASVLWTSQSELMFRYEVRAGDRDADGISIGADALALNGGSIRSAYGVDAVLDLGSHAIANAADYKVDGSITTAPEVSWARFLSSPQNGTAYRAGEEVHLEVEFSQPVEVAGEPQLALRVGGHTRQASLHSGYVSFAGHDLYFAYTVQAEDTDANGISVAANALSLNGGTISSAFTGAAAKLDLGVHAIADDPDHKVDGGG